jgi:uncharacterized protein
MTLSCPACAGITVQLRLESVSSLGRNSHSSAGEYKKALPLLIEAAELGDDQAMSLLGSMYLLGQGTPENGREALRWLEKSHELGYEPSISVLGMAYVTGKAGIKIDLDKARALLTYAAERGDEKSARMLGMIERGEGMFRGIKKKRR